MTSNYSDLSTVSADRVDELAAALANITRRRATIAEHIEAANAEVAAADLARVEAVGMIAAGKHDSKALNAALAKKREADDHLAAFVHADAELDIEEAQTRKFSERCIRLVAEAEKKALMEKAHTAAVELDSAAAIYGAAFDKWREAKEAAHVFALPIHDTHAGSGVSLPFSKLGAGFDASASLPARIKSDLANVAFPNQQTSVANPRRLV